jgi:hypothetical protein
MPVTVRLEQSRWGWLSEHKVLRIIEAIKLLRFGLYRFEKNQCLSCSWNFKDHLIKLKHRVNL